MTKKIGFKKVPIKATKPNDPEALFRDLRGRSPEIQHLWSHQADLVRAYYQNHLRTKDISLELPTGTGKTLIGLLIGEYRRVNSEERVVYLCPTRQLAHQVHELAHKYGIKTHVFVGAQDKYPPAEFSEYLTGQAIGISTYSGIFNNNPKIENPNVIIFDDAHSAENYISSLWSLQISRYDHEDLFLGVISIFKDRLPSHFVENVKNTRKSSKWSRLIEMIPTPFFWERIEALRDLFEENVKENPQLYFSWMSIRGNLEACNLFISETSILIRPWIPPSLTHPPFKNATQRIYMSATLGSGGELERIIGVQKIDRIPVPAGWDRQGSGRRFIIFPDYSFKLNDYSSWLADRIKSQDRTLILCPDRFSAYEIEDTINTHAKDRKYQILKSGDIEDSLEPFITKKNVSLILTNRYDGLDLPGDACRQLIVYGLPGGTNIQERFLLNRLGLSSLLKDRIRTRFTQATGRTTRGSADYSLVIPVGKKLFEFCMKKENREEMHPEIQAELSFGIAQSKVSKLTDLTELIELFFEQGTEWKEAEKGIVELRGEAEIKRDESSIIFNSIVQYEVDYMYQLWRGDYEGALASARKIIDRLSGEEFHIYRALWGYFVGCLGWKLDKKDVAMDFFKRAESCSKTVSWFSGLAKLLESMGETSEEIDLITGYAIENIQQILSEFGPVGKKFEHKINEIRANVESAEASQFETGLTELGGMMGFLTDKPGGKGAPDSVWTLAEKIVILFESKSEEKPDGDISIDTCRQASGHYKWAEKNVPSYDRYEKKFSVVVSPRKCLDKDAVPHADNLWYMHIDHIRTIFREIESTLRTIRSQSIKFNEEKIRSEIFQELSNCKLDTKSFIANIEQQSLLKLSTK